MNHKHMQIDGIGIVVGVSFLHSIELDKPELIYLSENDPMYNIIGAGWRYINGKWHEPLPPSKDELIQQEINAINAQLRQIYEEEKYNEWLRIDNNTISTAIQTISTQDMTVAVESSNNKEQLIQRLKELNEQLT